MTDTVQPRTWPLSNDGTAELYVRQTGVYHLDGPSCFVGLKDHAAQRRATAVQLLRVASACRDAAAWLQTFDLTPHTVVDPSFTRSPEAFVAYMDDQLKDA